MICDIARLRRPRVIKFVQLPRLSKEAEFYKESVCLNQFKSKDHIFGSESILLKFLKKCEARTKLKFENSEINDFNDWQSFSKLLDTKISDQLSNAKSSDNPLEELKYRCDLPDNVQIVLRPLKFNDSRYSLFKGKTAFPHQKFYARSLKMVEKGEPVEFVRPKPEFDC
ncbi:MAG: hypothetical protein MHMPM18_001533 [Marteilia pararefringens]